MNSHQANWDSRNDPTIMLLGWLSCLQEWHAYLLVSTITTNVSKQLEWLPKTIALCRGSWEIKVWRILQELNHQKQTQQDITKMGYATSHGADSNCTLSWVVYVAKLQTFRQQYQLHQRVGIGLCMCYFLKEYMGPKLPILSFYTLLILFVLYLDRNSWLIAHNRIQKEETILDLKFHITWNKTDITSSTVKLKCI